MIYLLLNRAQTYFWYLLLSPFLEENVYIGTNYTFSKSYYFFTTTIKYPVLSHVPILLFDKHSCLTNKLFPLRNLVCLYYHSTISIRLLDFYVEAISMEGFIENFNGYIKRIIENYYEILIRLYNSFNEVNKIIATEMEPCIRSRVLRIHFPQSFFINNLLVR